LQTSFRLILTTVYQLHRFTGGHSKHFRLPLLVSGTNYHVTSRLDRRCEFSGSRLKTQLFSRYFPDFLWCLWSDVWHYWTL